MSTDRVRARTARAGAMRAPAALGAGFLACAAVAVLAALAAGGDAPLVRDAGAAVRYGAPVTALLADLAISLSFGGAVLAGWVLRGREDRAAAMALVASAAAVATLARLGALVVSYARATGQGIGSARFGSDLGVFLATDLGVWMLVCTLFAAGATTVAVAGGGPWIARCTAVLLGLAIFSTAMTGHAAGGDTHEVATSTMLVHLLAVGVWVGGLLALQLLPAGVRDDAGVVRGYSRLALIAWVALALSGVWALAVRMTSPAELLTSAYVQLALAKAILLLALGGLGALQRRALAQQVQGTAAARVEPVAARRASATVSSASPAARAASAAGDGRRHPDQALYRRLALIELALMGLAIALGAAMSSSPPPADAAPPALGPAAVLSGYALPPAPSPLAVLTAWRPDPFGMALACGALLWWWRPGAPDRSRRTTARMLVAGAALVLVTSGALNVYSKVLVSAHLTQHLALLAVGMLAGASVGIPQRLRGAGRLAEAGRLTGAGRLRAAGRLTGAGRLRAAGGLAVLVALGPLAALIGWYAWPWLLRAALDGHAAHLALQLLALAAGCALALGARAAHRPLLVVLAAALMLLVCGAVLALGDALLAPSWFGATGRTWLADAAADQRRGGILVLLATGIGALAASGRAVGPRISRRIRRA